MKSRYLLLFLIRAFYLYEKSSRRSHTCTFMVLSCQMQYSTVAALNSLLF